MSDGSDIKIDRRKVERSLKAVLKSEHFINSSQLRDFLQFIVSKTLDGKQEEIKAYTIAVDALGRSEDFDPQTNAAVRVAAGRLRQSLSLYNASETARLNSITITLEAGSYIPLFLPIEIPESSQLQMDEVAVNSNTTVQVKPSPYGPIFRWLLPSLGFLALVLGVIYYFSGFLNKTTNENVDLTAKTQDINSDARNPLVDEDLRPKITISLVFPDSDYPGWYNTGEITDSIAHVVASFDDYQFLGAVSGASYPLNDKRNADYDFYITAYKRGENVRMFGKLIREEDGVVLWSTQELFYPPTDVSKRNIPEIAGRIYSPVGSPYGIIYADLLKSGLGRRKLSCTVSMYSYFNHKSNERHLKARNCAEKLIKEGTNLPSIHAALTFLYLDEYREGRNKQQHDPLIAAEKTALRAVELGPQSARAHQAVFAVRKVRGNYKEARKFAERAIQLNPYDTDILGDYAAWLISIGDLHEGKKRILQVEELLKARPAWIEVFHYLALDLNGDTKEADELANQLDITRSPLTAFVVALSSHRQGMTGRRKTALSELSNTSPEFVKNPKANFIIRGFAPEIAKILADRLLEVIKSAAESG